jgi:Spy/CpxP family protein refolding chaperone
MFTIRSLALGAVLALGVTATAAAQPPARPRQPARPAPPATEEPSQRELELRARRGAGALELSAAQEQRLRALQERYEAEWMAILTPEQRAIMETEAARRAGSRARVAPLSRMVPGAPGRMGRAGATAPRRFQGERRLQPEARPRQELRLRERARMRQELIERRRERGDRHRVRRRPVELR